MARVFAADRKHDLVIKCLEKALKIDPYYAAGWNNLGLEYSEIGDNEKSIECYKEYPAKSRQGYHVEQFENCVLFCRRLCESRNVLEESSGIGSGESGKCREEEKRE